MCAGEALLGVPGKALGEDFIAEFDRIAAGLEDFLRSDLRNLLLLLNVASFGRFTREDLSYQILHAARSTGADPSNANLSGPIYTITTARALWLCS